MLLVAVALLLIIGKEELLVLRGKEEVPAAAAVDGGWPKITIGVSLVSENSQYLSARGLVSRSPHISSVSQSSSSSLNFPMLKTRPCLGKHECREFTIM